jgi:hypothetical protein
MGYQISKEYLDHLYWCVEAGRLLEVLEAAFIASNPTVLGSGIIAISTSLGSC